MEPGVDRFIADIEQSGAKPQLLGDFITYLIIPGFGALEGKHVKTAIAKEEAARWPQVPPHWLHFPAEIIFDATNSQPSNLTGWVQHSRQIQGWGQSQSTANDWLGHVRTVLAEARN